jgi:hypothetical protein
MKIELTKKEADLLTDFIADASYLTPHWSHEPKIADLIKFGEDYKYETAAAKVIDNIWGRVAHKIGKTDSCGDCKSKTPIKVCKKI